MIFSKVLNEKPFCDIPYLVLFTLLVMNITGVFLVAKQLKKLLMSVCSFVSPDQLAISALNFSEYAKIQTFSHTPYYLAYAILERKCWPIVPRTRDCSTG